MDTEKPRSGASPPPLVVRVQGHDRSLPGNRSYLAGRDPQCDIVLTDDRVSWHHAVLRPEGGRWVLVDNGSTNGTYADGQRVARIEIGHGRLTRGVCVGAWSVALNGSAAATRSSSTGQS